MQKIDCLDLDQVQTTTYKYCNYVRSQTQNHITINSETECLETKVFFQVKGIIYARAQYHSITAWLGWLLGFEK